MNHIIGVWFGLQVPTENLSMQPNNNHGSFDSVSAI